MKSIQFTFAWMLWTLFLPMSQAVPIDSLTALHAAQEMLLRKSEATPHLHKVSPHHRELEARQLSLRHTFPSARLFTSPGGAFVLTANDSHLPLVLGYGWQGKDLMPAPVQAYCHTMEHLPSTTTLPHVTEWPPVAPLLGDTWRHQKDPFNRHCPYYTDLQGNTSAERCVVGCVATALEEVISYYGREITLADTLHGWSTDHYTIPDVLPGTRVDASRILPCYEEGAYTEVEANEVARLSYFCGVAAHMNWGLSESGANIRRLTDPLQRAFGFGFVHYADSYQYTPGDWTSMIAHELLASRPVVYAGYTELMQGHAFVVDGMDADGFFHVNWGYGGNYDGYFRLDLLCAAEPKHDLGDHTGGFFCNQEILLLHPDPVDVALPDTLERTGQEIIVESMTPALPPERGKYTPVQLILHNRAAQSLTTPFELFTNAPSDTAFFEQGDYVALTGTTLAPGERDTVMVTATFTKTGQRILRISPDDVNIVCETPVTVLPPVAPQLTYDPPSISFPDATTARIHQTIRNAEDAGRCGQNVVYCLRDGDTEDARNLVSHTHRLYLAAGMELNDSIDFRGLTPGQTYTLWVRNQWPVVQRLTFTQGTLPVLVSPPCGDTDALTDPTEVYGIDGRHIFHPQSNWPVILRNGKKRILSHP